MSSVYWSKDIEQKSREYFIINASHFIATFEFEAKIFCYFVILLRQLILIVVLFQVDFVSKSNNIFVTIKQESILTNLWI